jgi:outer membrane protein assembly factor BamB
MLYRIVLVFLSLSLFSAGILSGQFSQWRGPQRNGIYPEKGLLKVWPEKGPEMLWSYEGLGAGHGSVGFSKDKFFVLGMPDTTGVLYAFDYTGKLLWKKNYGVEWHENYTGTRSTPAIVGDLVYFESGQGVVYCYNGNTGVKIWSVDLLSKFDARNITWGMAESLLIEGDRLFCTPGGKKNNIVALNRFTGETIWTSSGNGQPAAYCSPIYVRHNKTALIVTMTAESIIGVDALTGQCYWQVPQFQVNKIHANTPVYAGGKI